MSKQNNTCRLCLSTDAYINVLEDDAILNNIIIHCKVKVEKNDGLPEYICYSCMQRVADVSKFIEQCCQNDTTLRLQCIENKFIKKDEGVSISIIKDDDDDETGNHDFPDNTSDYKNEEVFSYSPEKFESMNLDNDALMRSVQVAENGEEYVLYFGIRIIITRPKMLRKKKKIYAKQPLKKYICPICGLYRTIKHQHHHGEVELKFFCEICKAGFKTKSHLRAHVNRHHSGPKRFECSDCGKVFKCKDGLYRHIKYGHNIVPKSFACHMCEKAFYTKSGLTGHLLTHTGEKNFECTLCDTKCSTKSGLKSHMRVHTKEKPYSCKMCPKSFSSTSALRDHVLWHTGEKPHECPICKKAFAQAGNMKSHFRHNHKNSEFVYYSPITNLRSKAKISEK